MKMPEVILAERFHELNIGIYDENGVDGNIYLNNLPDEIPPENDEIISIYKNTGFQRELKILGGAIHPMMNIFISGRDFARTAQRANDIAEMISEDSYIKDDYVVYQSYIFTEPTNVSEDEKENFVFSFNLLMCIGYK